MNRADTNARFEAVNEWFDRLIDLDPAERQQQLHSLRHEDADLAMRVERLLSADDCQHGVLEDGLAMLAPAALRLAEKGGQESNAAHSANEVIGPWRLLRMLGSGGMGEVWLAARDDGQFQQQVALKLLKRGMDSDAVLRRFRRERQILARIEHPGIARLIDGGMTASGLPYFAMEYIEGMPITAFAEARALDARARVRLVIGLCNAVDYAHRRLIVHRDLKPGNVLVADDGALKVLDFGIAKLLDSSEDFSATATQDRLMSPAYAAPEQIFGEPIAIATDVYAIGLILFELLSGELPHGRNSGEHSRVSADIARDITEAPSKTRSRRHRQQQMPVATSANTDSELDLITLQALRREPEQRYRNASEFSEDLQAWLDQRPIRARPATLGYRLGKFVRRNRLAVSIAASAMAVVLATLWVAVDQRRAALLSAQVANGEARRAERSKDFLVSLFNSADAFSQRNHGERTVVDMLETASKRLETELTEDPSVQVPLLVEIDHVLRRSDRQAAIERTQRQLLAITKRPDVDPASRALALKHVGFYENDRHELIAARDHLEASLALYRSLPGDHRSDMISVRTGLARNASLRGALAESLSQRQAILKDRIALTGERDADVAMDYSNLGTSLFNMGRYADASAAFEHAYELVSTLLGPQHSRSQLLLRNLAETQITLGQLDEARHSIERILQVSDSIATTELRGRAHQLMGRIAYYEHRLDDSEREFGLALQDSAEPVLKIAIWRLLGRVHLLRHDYPQAADSFQQSLLLYGQDSAASQPYRWSKFLLQLANFRIDAKATPLTTVREAHAAMAAITDADPLAQFEAALLLGQAERDAGEYARALQLHRAALVLTEQHSILGALGQALAHAEIARDLADRNTVGDRDLARQSAQQSLQKLGDIDSRDPRFAAMRKLVE